MLAPVALGCSLLYLLLLWYSNSQILLDRLDSKRFEAGMAGQPCPHGGEVLVVTRLGLEEEQGCAGKEAIVGIGIG